MAWRPRLVSMPIISMIWRSRRPTSSARWTLSGSRRGRACGRTRSAKRAITSASSVSVLAKRPIARAKSRILARVNDTERQPNAGQGRRNSGFEAASRLQYNKGDGQSLEADDQVVHPLALIVEHRMPRLTV